MAIEQKTFTPQKATISKNGAEVSSVTGLKPLTPEQLSAIDNLKEGSINRFIAQLLVDRRKQGKPTAMEEFVNGYISIHYNNNHNTGIPDEEDIKKKVRDVIGRSLRPKFKAVGLFIVNHYDTGKKRGSFYFLNTREELPTQQDLAQFRTLRDLSGAIDEPNLLILRSRVYTAMRRDPTIKGHHLATGGDSKKLFFTQDAFEKLIEAIKAAKTVAENGKNNNKDNTLDDQDDDEPQDLIRNPFRHEFHARSILGRTEQMREDLIIRFTDTILSHLLIGAMEELSRDAKDLLDNLLPQYSRFKVQFSLLTSDPAEQFLANSFVKRVEELWEKHPNSTNSQQDKRTTNYCLRLKEQGYALQKIVDIMYQHFSIPSASTSAPAP